jgi:hypothetical protein
LASRHVFLVLINLAICVALRGKSTNEGNEDFKGLDQYVIENSRSRTFHQESLKGILNWVIFGLCRDGPGQAGIRWSDI